MLPSQIAMSRKPGPSDAIAAVATASSAPIKVGRLAPDSKPGALVVDFDGNTEGPLPARSLVVLDKTAISQAVGARRSVVLLFENQDPRLPIVAWAARPR
jgi:hypothetical protein